MLNNYFCWFSFDNSMDASAISAESFEQAAEDFFAIHSEGREFGDVFVELPDVDIITFRVSVRSGFSVEEVDDVEPVKPNIADGWDIKYG